MILTYQDIIVNGLPGINIFLDDKPYGNPLNDQVKIPDGYRYHDVLHLSFLKHLGYSHTVLYLLELTSNRYLAKLEENISLFVFKSYKAHDFNPDASTKLDIVTSVRFILEGLENIIINASDEQWIMAMDFGIQTMRLLFNKEINSVDFGSISLSKALELSQG